MNYLYEIDIKLSYLNDKNLKNEITETIGFSKRTVSNEFFTANIVGNFLPSK